MKYAIGMFSLVLAAGCAASASSQRSTTTFEQGVEGKPKRVVRVTHEGSADHKGFNASVAGALFGAESVGGMGLGGYGHGGYSMPHGVVAIVDQVTLDGGNGGYAAAASGPTRTEAAVSSEETDAVKASLDDVINAQLRFGAVTAAECAEYLKQNLEDKKSEACKGLRKKGER